MIYRLILRGQGSVNKIILEGALKFGWSRGMLAEYHSDSNGFSKSGCSNKREARHKRMITFVDADVHSNKSFPYPVLIGQHREK